MAKPTHDVKLQMGPAAELEVWGQAMEVDTEGRDWASWETAMCKLPEGYLTEENSGRMCYECVCKW